MSTSKIEREIADIAGSFQECDPKRMSDYKRAIERYNDLERKGLVQKRGNSLLPIEERYKLIAEYRNSR